MLFLLYVNDLPDVVENSKIACFADDTKIFRPVDSNTDASLLQSDLSNLDKWSASNNLTFNELKCKHLSVTRKTNPISYPYYIKNKELTVTTVEKDLGIWITSDLTWAKHVLDRCWRANTLLGFLKRSCAEVKKTRTRRTLYLTVVRSVLGYSSQVWCPQSINLIQRTERIQRRATKFILNLPYLCGESYRERLISLDLLPLSYWHEYLDLVFFFKAVNGIIVVSEEVLPQPLNQSRTTRSTSVNLLTFRPPKCKTLTYQRSFFVRVTRVWNSLSTTLRSNNINLVKFKSLLLNYYSTARQITFDPEDPRTWKTVCLKCNYSRPLDTEVTCCF